MSVMAKPKTKVYKRKRSALLRVAIVLLIPIVLFLWADNNLRPVILTMAEARARVMGVKAMNDAVFEVIGKEEIYSDLMSVVLDANGRVSMMQANTARMNELSTEAVLAVLRNLDSIAAQGISIPLGAALGSKLLAGSGPAVHVRIVPAGSVTTEFISEFTSAGINQTRHRIFLEINTNVQMVLPTGAQTATVSAHMPIAESIIVGEVPQSFVDVASKEDLLMLDAVLKGK